MKLKSTADLEMGYFTKSADFKWAMCLMTSFGQENNSHQESVK